MKYYLKQYVGLFEISKKEYYSMRRRKNAHESVMYGGGRKTGRYLTFY